MSLWQIRAYYLEGGSCPILTWYAAQDEEVQAGFDATLTTLRATMDWTDTDIWQFKALTRNDAGLGEIRFNLKGPPLRRFRPVGIWPPIVEREFILLLGCEKLRNGIYIPNDAFAVALEYKRRCDAGIGEVHDYF